MPTNKLPSKRAITIKDVANIAAVSPATVSRVVSGKIVSSQLKQRVLEAVQTTGYRPNLAARRLRAKTSDTIGLIIADIRNPFFTRIARAIDDIAKTHGQHVILCNTDENPAREKAYLDLMEEENVAGIILAATLSTIKNPRQIVTTRPLILIDRKPQKPLYDAVVIDNREGAKKLVRHLYHHGRKHIVCLYGATSTTGLERQKGYQEAMEELGLCPETYPVQHAQETWPLPLKTLLDKHPLPDALVVTNGVLALKVATFLQNAAIYVPEKIALAAFDDEPWMKLVFNGLTTIAQPIRDIASETYHGLIERLANPQKPVSQTVLSSELVIRGSTLKTLAPLA
ncbi:LacI family DNA-binding transcriptional regulator [uncultured Bartonella sp.]|uniref:LacI family DNA-binding transcriptional regulator n=1 Tax=uncultured Bartonella sp. TaxID=104108 RepID=UPI0026241B7F|nr:LacI family DNA-binding transcriptional regulator [uncultured Bartonella sp.]